MPKKSIKKALNSHLNLIPFVRPPPPLAYKFFYINNIHSKDFCYPPAATGHAGVKGMIVGEFMLLLDRSSEGDEKTFPASTVT